MEYKCSSTIGSCLIWHEEKRDLSNVGQQEFMPRQGKAIKPKPKSKAKILEHLQILYIYIYI